tara:strand:+ start:7116 stop:8408 length:1293 start_codon:yes stop_codon:yes gene_type:complete
MTEDKKWPDASIERLQAYADRTGVKVGEAVNEFKKWLKAEFSVDNPLDEDEYLLVEWTEMFVIETRNLGGSGGSSRATSTYVGHLVGIEDTSRDMRKSARENALNMFRANSDRAISEKLIGIVTAKEGVWHINGEATTERVDGSNLPWFALEEGDTILCLLNTNAASASVGKPMAPTSFTRTLYLLGSEEKSNKIGLWRVTLNGKSMDAEYNYHEPCKVQVIPPKDITRDTLYTNRDFHTTIEYTDSFVPDNLRQELQAQRFLLNENMHDASVDLSELAEAHADRKIKLPSGVTLNPTIIVKGNVSRLNKQAMDSEYDATGRSYRMNITSLSLQSRNGRDSAQSEVTVWIPGRLHDEHHPFEYELDGIKDNWTAYAEKTPVIVFGRLKMRPYQDDMLPSITALGIYVPPRTARPAGGSGSTDLNQFGGDE